jgi:diguanylate cyclase (GGDEF)-like protein
MPDNRAVSHKRPKPRKPRKPILGIRARLIVLALLAMAPLMFERVHALESARAERTRQAHTRVMAMARHAAEAQEDAIASVRALLQIMARVYVKMPSDAEDCDHFLTMLTGNVPWVRVLSIAGTNGQITCSTAARAVGLNIGDRPHFQRALHLNQFTVSDYIVSQTDQVPTVFAGFPVIGNDGAVRGVVLASINLQWMSKLATDAVQRPGTSALLIDGGGRLVAASANERDFIGKDISGRPLLQNMLANDQGTMTGTDLDGRRRIFGFVRVPWTQARLAVGVDEAAVESGIDREISIAYVQLGLIGIFVLIVTWFGGERLIVRPIRSLVRTVARFGRGDLNARASQESWVAEFEPLAAAFDDMADKLALREEELRVANQHLEELASLDGLTGLANRRGFDRELERAWRSAMDIQRPVALMMIDIDHFKLYNDCYGHVAGDACLRAVGETLSLVTLEEAVLVARYGGEEFALLLPGLDLGRAEVLAEEARKSIEDLMIRHAEAPCGLVTISVGVESLVPEQGEAAADLVEAADTALYAAKRRGRNTVVTNTPALLSMAS